MNYHINGYYHLYNRGYNKENIFREKSDYEKLLEIIVESKISEYLDLCAFSFMPNHYHFLVRQKTSKAVSSWIQYIFNRYVKYFNKKYDRKGTIFEGKVKTKHIDNLKYIGNIAHYIHLNPTSDFLRTFCSIKYLKTNFIVDLNFYNEFFGNTENYFKCFEIYKNSKQKEDISKYFFEFK